MLVYKLRMVEIHGFAKKVFDNFDKQERFDLPIHLLYVSGKYCIIAMELADNLTDGFLKLWFTIQGVI